MANGGGKQVNWDTVKDVAQVLIYPILMGMLYLLFQSSSSTAGLPLSRQNPLLIRPDPENSRHGRPTEHGHKDDSRERDKDGSHRGHPDDA